MAREPLPLQVKKETGNPVCVCKRESEDRNTAGVKLGGKKSLPPFSDC